LTELETAMKAQDFESQCPLVGSVISRTPFSR
jgi:hypothetical protein